MATLSTKRPTNVSLDTALLAEARDLGLNVSQACEEGLRRGITATREMAWLAENGDALASSNAYVELNGLPLAAFRHF